MHTHTCVHVCVCVCVCVCLYTSVCEQVRNGCDGKKERGGESVREEGEWG